jgi:predicted ABC-type sugar transport system permease subunit
MSTDNAMSADSAAELGEPAAQAPTDLAASTHQGADANAASARRLRTPVGGRSLLARFSGVYILVAFIVVYGFWVPKTFLTVTTLQSVIGDQAVTGVVTIGVVFALSAGAFDLSFANNLGLSGVICAALMVNEHVSPPIAIVLTLLFGTAVGAVNAFFVVRVGVSSIIVTLGMSSILSALNSDFTSGGQLITSELHPTGNSQATGCADPRRLPLGRRDRRLVRPRTHPAWPSSASDGGWT